MLNRSEPPASQTMRSGGLSTRNRIRAWRGGPLGPFREAGRAADRARAAAPSVKEFLSSLGRRLSLRLLHAL